MFDFIVTILQIVIFVSAIGSFVVLKPLFSSLTKTQKLWVIILVISTVITFFVTEIPDMVQGFNDGLNAGK
ncbi:hypothetical protein [Leuconostoc lactis]|uniref:hypothetical protein n=1 Tax=Leuconostoc lactis TaxID=1246 RepID=UPI000517B4F5|nr:hypothetical protein [Leuconostoc lactis]AIS74064.1 hypothetical protein [Leuconostoc phage LLC-1]MCT3115524.1 hypothetical protein [Leuconostoc lactis]